MDKALGRRSSLEGGGRRLALAAIVVVAVACGVGCMEGSASGLAARILERYRKVSGAKPLASAGMIRIRLTPAAGGPARGSSEILWEQARYRETVSSAGWTTVRGVELGKAYFIDADGVTRVLSDPALWELQARSYFWRRAWLFRDQEGARMSLGPADDRTVSVRLKPEGGNPILLSFSRADGRLLSVRSPRFQLEFPSAVSFQDRSNPRAPVDGQIAWTGLPTGRMPNPTAGGGRARFSEVSTRVAFERPEGAVVVPATLSGRKIRLAIDAAADGLVLLSPALAASLPLAFQTDVYGRSVAAGACLTIGSATYPSLFAQSSDAVPAFADAVAGAPLFREAVVEFDPETSRFGLHDPSRWVTPDGFFKAPIDDDGDRPVAIIDRGHEALRLTAGTSTGDAALVLATASAVRAGVPAGPASHGLTWAVLKLPPLPVRISPEGFSPDWGNDGDLGFPLLLRFHAYMQMPIRWIYLRAAG